MARAARLLDIVQMLRGRHRPVPGRELAERLGISLRTLYRDIATLQGEGAPIDGGAGLGFVLRAGFTLPPLMFDADELDALILGLRFAGRRGDAGLAAAAARALAKIEAVLPPARADAAAASPLLAGASRPGGRVLAAIREAIRREEKVRIGYTDQAGRGSERVVWPIAVGFFDAGEILAAWCETRADFRHFRLDRIVTLAVTGERLPRRQAVLLAEWRLFQDLQDAP